MATKVYTYQGKILVGGGKVCVTPPTDLFLDLLSVPSIMAVSNFKRRSSYAGALYRFQNSLSQQEDIGPNANNYVDLVEYDSFAGGNPMVATIWYDQALTPHTYYGNAHGYKSAINGLFGLDFYDGVERYYLSAESFSFGQPFTALAVTKMGYSGYRGWTSENGGLWRADRDPSQHYQGYAGLGVSSSEYVDTVNPHIVEFQFNGGSSDILVDGVSQTLASHDFGANTHVGGVLIGLTWYTLYGQMCECYLFSGLFSVADRVLIKSILGTAYGIVMP